MMTNYELTVVLSNGDVHKSIVAYNRNLTVAQVTAALKRRCRTVHGRRLAGVMVVEQGESSIPNQAGMV